MGGPNLSQYRAGMIRLAPLLLAAACIHSPAYRELVSLPAQKPRTVLIHDVRVFNGLEAKAGEHQDVFLSGGKIENIAPASAAPAQADLMIDGRGLTLLPGFVDLHAHLTLTGAPPWYPVFPKPEHNAQAHVYSGVTTVL